MFGKNENTEEKIISATFKILREEGVQKATTKKIAAEAGVNEITIFRKFENKKNLVQVTKDYYLNALIEKLENTFSFEEDDEIENYIQNCFYGVLEYTREDFSVIQVAMQEVQDTPDRKLLMSQITDAILFKLEDFFKLKKEKGVIKDLNPMAVAILCYSIIFQSVILWQIYGNTEEFESDDSVSEDILEMIYHGILP